MKLALSVLLSLAAVFAHAGWTPPAHPDAQKILDEAEADTSAGRYDNALAKHLWFHENALKLDPALSGVRLSFAISDWEKLGAVYPPALEKLKAIRDEAGKAVRESVEYRQAFIDFESFNRDWIGDVNEDNKTKELFIWLDANKPNVATNVYDVAQRVLVAAKEFHLCGKYINPDSSYQRILLRYRENMHGDSDEPNLFRRRYQQNYDKNRFEGDVYTLVALLVLNERKADADRIATEATKVLNTREFKKALKEAKNGKLPVE
jgi:hypothetical protein